MNENDRWRMLMTALAAVRKYPPAIPLDAQPSDRYDLELSRTFHMLYGSLGHDNQLLLEEVEIQLNQLILVYELEDGPAFAATPGAGQLSAERIVGNLPEERRTLHFYLPGRRQAVYRALLSVDRIEETIESVEEPLCIYTGVTARILQFYPPSLPKTMPADMAAQLMYNIDLAARQPTATE